MTDFAGLIRALHRNEVEFILIGGLAAAHGAIRATTDVDVVYSRTDTNIARLVSALVRSVGHRSGQPS